MGIRQYIGARYVPKFFDNNGSSDWVSGVAYEALTIVTYLGNSYTSKIPVPSNVGNPADNPTYWVSTGTFNEQIAELRSEINEVKDYSGVYNVVKYGADNTGTEYANEAIIAAATAADGNGAIYFPSGVYMLSAPLDLTAYDIFSIVGDDAIITSNVTLDYLLKPFPSLVTPERKRYAKNIRGLQFIGDGIVRNGLRLGTHHNVSDCHFSNFTVACITGLVDDVRNGGFKITDCTFIDTEPTRICKGIIMSTDNIIDSCRFYGFSTAIDCNSGGNVLTTDYFWNQHKTIETIGIESPSTTSSIGCHVVNCEFDTINKPFYRIAAYAENCLFAYDDISTNEYKYYVHYSQSVNNYIAGVFIACTFSLAEGFNPLMFQPFYNKPNTTLVGRYRLTRCSLNNIPTGTGLSNLVDNDTDENLTTNASNQTFSDTNTWYKIATVHRSIAHETGQIGIMFKISEAQNGRSAHVSYGSSQSRIGIGDTTDYAFKNRLVIGAVVTANEVNFYVKPSVAIGGYFMFNEVYINRNGADFVPAYEVTSLTDADMTAMSDNT